MKDIFRILLISLLSFTIISCSKKDESSSSSDSNISMNDIKGNVKNNSTYLTTKDSTSSSRMNKLKQTRNSNKTSTSSDSLITFDENGNVDYGLITNHNIKIDQLIQLDSQKSIAIFDYNDHNTWQHLIKLNCGIIILEFESTNVSCFVYGIPPISIAKHYQFDADIYGLNPFQKNDEYLYFRSNHTNDNTVDDSLKCSHSCVYSYDLKSKQVKKLSKDNIGVEKFIMLQNNDLIYRGLLDEKRDDGTSIETGIMYISDNSSSEFEIPNTSSYISDVNNGDYKSLLWTKSSDGDQYSIIFRKDANQSIYSFIESPIPEMFTTIKGKNGIVYGQTRGGLYSILPFKSNPIIKTPYTIDNITNSIDCFESSTCSIFFEVLSDYIVSNHIDFNHSQKPTVVTVTRISDNKTLKVVKPNNNCSLDCFQIDNSNEIGENGLYSTYTKWYVDENTFYIPMYDLNAKKNVLIKIVLDALDFDNDGNQYSIVSNLDDYLNNKKINSLTSYQTKKNNSDTPTANIFHESNDNKSLRINFNNIMDYKSVEGSISISDNSTNNNISFMPFWNNKTLHLIIDTNIGSTQDFNENVFTSGTTYKVTLSGSAKDSDGNTIGSDVVKYITP